MQQQGNGPAAGRPPSPRRPTPPVPQDHKLVAADRGQKPPLPPMRGAVKGNAQDALAFFGGGFQKR